MENSGTILYVAKISYQSDNWFGNCYKGYQKVIQTHRETDRQKDTHTHTHTHTHTYTEAHFISLVFLRKGRNKTKKISYIGNIQNGIGAILHDFTNSDMNNIIIMKDGTNKHLHEATPFFYGHFIC